MAGSSAADLIAQWQTEMAEIRTEVRGLRAAQREAERLVREVDAQGLTTQIAKGLSLVEREAKKLAPVYTGRLRASITPSIQAQMTPTGAFVRGVVGTNVKYAGKMEFGGPLESPFVDILRWVHIKRIAGVYSIRTRRRLGSKKRQLDEDRAVAARIYRSMKAKGVQAHPFLFAAVDKCFARLMALFQDYVVRIVKR